MPEPYEQPLAIAAEDIDLLGHVNNVVYVRWIQQVAMSHWCAVAPLADQEALLWIVLRHEIDYKRQAFLGDRLVARTWVGEASRLKFDRHTEILLAESRTPVVKARTVWCPIDRKTGKPTIVSAQLRAAFSTGLSR